MITFINPYTGTETMVTDERKDEYLRAGFKLALEAPAQKPVESVKEVKEEPKKEVKKTVTRTRKK
jgi:hypothetical protein